MTTSRALRQQTRMLKLICEASDRHLGELLYRTELHRDMAERAERMTQRIIAALGETSIREAEEALRAAVNKKQDPPLASGD